MKGREFDFSALHREPTQQERKRFREAGVQGRLGPDFEPPSGIGCQIAGWLFVAALVVLFLVHWHEGAGTWARVIESAIVLVLVGVGVGARLKGDTEEEAKRIAAVQFAWANGITPWYGEYEGDVPVAARPDGCNERTITVEQRFRWAMRGREVQAGQFSCYVFGNEDWEGAFRHTRRYVAVRHDGDLPRCRYGPVTGSPLDAPSTQNELDWKRVDLDDHDPPKRWVWCENRAPARVREVFSTDWWQQLDTFDRVRYLEIDREWVSLRIEAEWDEMEPWDEAHTWEHAIPATDLVIERLVGAGDPPGKGAADAGES